MFALFGFPCIEARRVGHYTQFSHLNFDVFSYNYLFLGINIGGGYKSNVGYNKSRQLPQFLAAGLPCDSPEHRAIASEYPTYKLDQNTVVDNSISWERCNPDGAVNCAPNGAGGPTCNNTSQISLSNRFV